MTHPTHTMTRPTPSVPGMLVLSSLCFVVSGFAALIYQSVWSNYLGLVLGHAAYAQALVLSMFMGGMAIGAWLTSRIKGNVSKLLRNYAIVEVLIGLIGLVFHAEYIALSSWTQSTILPAIDSPALGVLWQWFSGMALVLPQSVLLGMTFPLLASASIHHTRAGDSSVLGTLYFSNSIGAVFGALAASFWLVPTIGTPGALRVAAVLNILVGLFVFAYRRARTAAVSDSEALDHREFESDPQAFKPSASDRSFLHAMFWASGITGATSFIYEIGWIRQLNLALGSTVHSFELMLSAFILGLALGGLTVRFISRRWNIDPVLGAALAQIAMGAVTLLCLVTYAYSFDFVELTMKAAKPSDEGYAIYLFATALWSIMTVSPAAFFAGMTLPWMTAAAVGRGFGPSQIGRVYAANTFGAIVGVYLTLHLFIPVLGVRLSLIVAALIDFLLGIALIWRYIPSRSRTIIAASLAGFASCLVAAQQWGLVSPVVAASGVFRSGKVASDSREVPYVRDGKTATVSMQAFANSTLAITTNGKIDGSIRMNPDGERSSDEITMVMTSVLPLSGRSSVRDIAVIGFGTGMTTHVALANPNVRSVDTVEIEPVMVEAARLYGGYNSRAYSDPRSHIIINDARTYFATGNRVYDLIISEPSNPWVSGVASLFTTEFYAEIKQHLQKDGILVQWIQAYELDDQLLATMMAALAEHFAAVDVYRTNDTDLILIARSEDAPFSTKHDQLFGPDLIAEAQARGLTGPNSLQVRRLLDTEGVKAYVALMGARPHSDFFPTVAHKGPAARFKNASPNVIRALVSPSLPWAQLVFGRPEWEEAELNRWHPLQGSLVSIRAAKGAFLIRDAWRSGRIDVQLPVNLPDRSALLAELMQMSSSCREGIELQVWIDRFVDVLGATTPFLSIADADTFAPGTGADRCTDPNASEQAWKALAAAVFRRDAREMERLAIDRLRSTSAISDNARQYLVSIIMLARLAQGNYAGVDSAQEEFDAVIPMTSRHYVNAIMTIAVSDVRERRPPAD